MKKMSALSIAAGVLVALAACQTKPGAPLTAPDADPGNPIGSWMLQTFELQDGSTVSVPRPSDYTLVLGDDGAAHVRADCNVCKASYAIEGSSLRFGPMACTLAACPEDSLEHDYLEALGSASMFQQTGDALALGYDGGVLRFRAE